MRRGTPIIKNCTHCDDTYDARAKNEGKGIKRMMATKYCSRGCMARHRALTHNQENHHLWKGGVFNDNGYIRVNKYKEGKPMQHDLVIEEHVGRKMTPNEVVHHIDRDRSNNELSNLQLMTRAEHLEVHKSLGHMQRLSYAT